MKNVLYLLGIAALIVVCLFVLTHPAKAALPITQVINGGTGWSNFQINTLLTGNGKNPLATTTVGSGLLLSGGVLSATGGTGTLTTSTPAVVPNLLYFTGASTVGNVATGTVSNGAGISVTAGQSVIGSGLTITNTGVISNSCPGGFLSCSGTNPSAFTLGTLGIANGGTASTTLGGILVGNGVAAIKSLVVGTGLSFDGTTLISTATNYFTNIGNLLFNNTGSSVGINVSSGVTAALEVAATSSAPAFIAWNSSLANIFNIQNSGFVGIGTGTPSTNLSVQGNGLFSGNVTLANLIATGTATIGTNATVATSTIVSDLAVGLNGITNPAFQVLGGIPAAETGVEVVPAAPASGVSILTTSSGANEALTVSSKGTGNLELVAGNAGGTIRLSPAPGSGRLSVSFGQIIFGAMSASTVAANVRFGFTGATDVTLTGTVEAPSVYYNLGQTRSHSSGVIKTQRDYRITPSTHTYTAGTSNANSTISSTTAFSIDSPDPQGANVNYTNVQGLWIGHGAAYTTASTTNAYGAVIDGPTGATNNYAASTTGRIVHTNLGTGAGIGSVCQAASGEILFDTGANCIVSSLRFKTIDSRIGTQDAFDTVMALSPIYFHYKPGYGNKEQQEGFGAEEVAKIDKDLVQYDAESKPYSVYYQNITAKLVGAIQYQQSEINKVTRSFEENWQWALIVFLFMWNGWLTLRKR